SLHRLDDGALLVTGELAPGLRILDEYHVAQQILGMIGNPYSQRTVGVHAHPLVRPGVSEIVGYVHSASSNRILPWRMNGGSTATASRDLPRVSTLRRSPGATPRGTRARAIERFMVGENPPLVVSPPPCAPESF